MKKLLFLILFLFPQVLMAELPVIEESVDQVALLNIEGSQYSRVLFIKDDQLLTTRLYIEEEYTLWAEGNEFVIMWRDYSIAHRIVRAKTFGVIHMSHDPTVERRVGPWWKMGRNMRDLKMPNKKVAK